MNAKTLEAVTRHGETLLRAFPNATEKNPVALCKKLRRIETVANRGATAYCNGETFRAYGREFLFGKQETAWDSFTYEVSRRVNERTLGNFTNDTDALPVFVNGDARGYALKIQDVWTRGFNAKQYAAKLPALHTDMGGYGILAPDLNQ